MKKFVHSVVLTLLCTGIAVAQHGTAEPDYYPSGFNGALQTTQIYLHKTLVGGVCLTEHLCAS